MYWRHSNISTMWMTEFVQKLFEQFWTLFVHYRWHETYWSSFYLPFPMKIDIFKGFADTLLTGLTDYFRVCNRNKSAYECLRYGFEATRTNTWNAAFSNATNTHWIWQLFIIDPYIWRVCVCIFSKLEWPDRAVLLIALSNYEWYNSLVQTEEKKPFRITV